MKSFRTELENPVVEQEIIELEKKIRQYLTGEMHPDRFKSLRLARGIYGQRQKGVQMIRIKLPQGRLTTAQLKRIADISDEYATGNLHLTTRQDIQLHFVSLERTPELWTKLALDDLTIREACGNTVRNITGSPLAGIDPNEPFDITPYADATFKYFLRNPVCQDLARKFKIGFSSSENDEAFAYIHDVGLIPRIQEKDGKLIKGFKVVVGGGLGAQPFTAKLAFEFLPAEDLIPYIEAILRVFDRYGERTNRHKARMKYLIEKLGMEKFTELVQAEYKGLKAFHVPISFKPYEEQLPDRIDIPEYSLSDQEKYKAWLITNVIAQKQLGYKAVYLKITNGNIPSNTARQLADLVKAIAADQMRVTNNQGILIRFVPEQALGYLFTRLDELGLAEPGFDSTADVTSCPGTDTCNLGISNSTGIARMLEQIIQQEYPQLIYNKDIKIKISGCMNSCGQHGIATIGFHGASLKAGGKVLPALQVLLGGGPTGHGEGRLAEKIIKIPSKRAPQALRLILNDYLKNAQPEERFNAYYDRQGKNYFYALLKPLADLTQLHPDDFVDWGHEEEYSTAVGVGECASVVVDLVYVLLNEAAEKLETATQWLQETNYADAIYQAYTASIYVAKALLLDKEVNCNTHIGIIQDFDQHFSAADFGVVPSFAEYVLQINKHEPTANFAKGYLDQAFRFYQKAREYEQLRNKQATPVTESIQS
ncbi:MAG: HEPN domain-containing protein [Thermoflavifilum sp.]|nr:HEPN domain-containing protein [Thermoflavifilum sp.]